MTPVGAPPPAVVQSPVPDRIRPAGPSEVPTRHTPLSGPQAAQALRTAWTRLRGEPPSDKTLSILVAQWSHETGAGRSMYNFNFGGIKGTGPSGLTTVCRTREGHGPTERTIRDHFRAYRSADEGAEDYLRLLEGRYGAAVDQARAGDSEEFVRALKRGGYFTGSETAYVRSVSQIAASVQSGGPSAVGAASGPSSIDYALRPARDAFAPSYPHLDHLDADRAITALTQGIPHAVARGASRILADRDASDQDLGDLLAS